VEPKGEQNPSWEILSTNIQKSIGTNSLHAIPDIHPTDERKFVIPVKTGIQYLKFLLDSRFRGNDIH
jgi:hypothetical protein